MLSWCGRPKLCVARPSMDDADLLAALANTCFLSLLRSDFCLRCLLLVFFVVVAEEEEEDNVSAPLLLLPPLLLLLLLPVVGLLSMASVAVVASGAVASGAC